MSEQVRTVEFHDLSGQLLALVIPHQSPPALTTFLTPPTFQIQAGYIVKEPGAVVKPHVHKPRSRHIRGTQELLLVQSGRAVITLYDNFLELTTLQLETGDLIFLLAGGHSIYFPEKTVLLEIKQGPYLPEADKRYFNPEARQYD